MKVVIWGHPLHTHTHSYIHEAFYKGFSYMGFETYWLADQPANPDDFNDCVVITEGQTDTHLPINKNARYLLHNCNWQKYQDTRSLILQVYTHDVRDRAKDNTNYTKLTHGTFVERSDQGPTVLYQPWATDLLPEEFDLTRSSYKPFHRNNINWVGTVGDGQFGNNSELDGFRRACTEKGFKFTQHSRVSNTEHRQLIQESYLAPAIVGQWQKEKGYIPCRIFKNISYGQVGLTNSAMVNELMEGNVIYNPDTYQLFNDAESKKVSRSVDTLNAMKFVQTNHTYVNRIKNIRTLLEF